MKYRLFKVGLSTLAALLLCATLLTSVGQVHAAARGTLTVNNTWTSAWGNYNTVVSSFNRGSQIQYNVSVSNSSGSNMNIRLQFEANLDTYIEDFSSAILIAPPGNSIWYVQDTVPQNATTGDYTLRANVSDSDNFFNSANSTGQFSVNYGGHFRCTSYVYSGTDHGASFIFLNDCAIQMVSNANDKPAIIASIVAPFIGPVGASIGIFETAVATEIYVLKQDSEKCNKQGALLELGITPPPIPVAVC